MTSPGLLVQRIAMLASIAALTAAGCESRETVSTYVGGYTLSQDYELERRVLRFQRDEALEARCMQSRLPVGTAPLWKQAVLDPSIHRRLTGLILDDTRHPSYEADTEASMEAEVFVCGPRPGGGESCYVPALVVLGLSSPLLFGLPPTEVELSAESQELIDEFLAAQEACWSGGEPMGQ